VRSDGNGQLDGPLDAALFAQLQGLVESGVFARDDELAGTVVVGSRGA